jgi:hypothetical protein
VPGAPQRKRESEALPAKLVRAARRNRAASVPLSVPLPVWTAAEIMHANGLPLEMAGTGAAIAGAGCVWLFAPHKWDRPAEVWYARLSAAAFAVWEAAAAFGDPVSAPAAGSLAVLAAAWGVPWYRHYRIRGRKEREEFQRGWQAFWDGHALTWANGSNMIEAEGSPAQVRLRIQLLGGKQSLETLKGNVSLIESAVPTGRGGVRVAEVEGNASQADVFITFANPLKGIVEWDPVLAPRSIHDPAFRGMSETGQRVMVAQRVSAFINGMSRTGKSNYEQLRIAELSGCADGRPFVIDLKQRNARPLLKSGAVDWVITDPEEAGHALRMLRAEIAARSREWDTGEEQALADEHTPGLFLLIDETNPLTSETAGPGAAARARDLGIIASQGMGVEVYTDVSTQYGALAESVQTEQTRSSLPLRVCFRVEHPDHGVFALGPGGGDASKLREKGEHLMKLGPKARMDKIRAANMPHALLEQVIAENGRRVRKRRVILFCGGEPSGVGGMTWQEWYDRRHLRIHPKLRDISPQYEAAVEEFGEPQQAAGVSVPDSSPLVRPYLAPVPPLPGDGESGAAVAARIAAETAGPDVLFTEEARARGAEIYAQSLETFFGLISSAPPEGIRKAELIELSGVSNGQAYKILNQLAERSAVGEPGRGLVAPVPGKDAAAEYAAMRAGNDALGRRAARRLESVG